MIRKKRIKKSKVVEILNRNDGIQVVSDKKVLSSKAILYSPQITTVIEFIDKNDQCANFEIKIRVDGKDAKFVDCKKEQILVCEISHECKRKSDMTVGGPTRPPIRRRLLQYLRKRNKYTISNVAFIEKKG